MATAADVLAGNARWAVECGDALEWLRGLPDDSIDLLVTSPPYEKARTYGIGEKMVGGEAWVKWMFDVVAAAAPKVKGLIAVNCEGQTRNYRYSCVPFLLAADLHRAGFNLRKPVVFHRVGIPGGGGPDWLRNDWEPVVCVTRPGRLPWSDNTACGHPPKWGPGGEMSHRMTDGTRVNQWCKTGTEAGVNGVAQRTRSGARQKAARPSHVMASRKVMTRKRDGMHNQDQDYQEPVLANPGNTARATYTADEVAAIFSDANDVVHCNVGGGAMGHGAASENEAPYPLKLAEFFVRSFCPPDGVVLDCFAGSGTTCHAAVLHGRRFVGCDLRQSQVDLVARRMATITPDLFAGAT